MHKYPEYIYHKPSATPEPNLIDDPDTAALVEKAFTLGTAYGTNLTGWENITEEVETNNDLDLQELVGKTAICAHETAGTLRITITGNWVERDGQKHLSRLAAEPRELENIFYEALAGDNGWTLWGEPTEATITTTADQLPPATCFLGTTGRAGAEPFKGITIQRADGSRWVLLDEEDVIPVTAQGIKVLEVYGRTFTA